MFRKIILAAGLALGMGSLALAVPSAQAAVVHPAANTGVIQAIEQAGPNAAQPVYHRGRPHWGHPHYRPHRRCHVKRVRVRTHHGWRWVSRRVCWR
ncbi:hypothetical protein [Labrys neptuniae]